MLAPELPSPLQSSQVYVLLLALQGSPSFFQKKNIQKHQKSRSHVTRVRIVRLRTNDCPSEPPVPGALHCRSRDTANASAAIHATIEPYRRSHAAFVRLLILPQTTQGKCVPSSGEQPSLKTHLATLHLFWLCHPFPEDKPESCRSQIMRLQRGTIRPPRLPEGVLPSL